MKLIQLIVSPAAAFAEIAREKRFIAAWMLSVVLFTVPMTLFVHRAGPMRLFASAIPLLRDQPGLEGQSPAEIADALATLFELMVVVLPIVAIPLTAVCLIPMIKAMQHDAGLPALMAVTSYAALPPAVGLCITACAAIWLRDPATLTFESLTPLNLGVLVPATGSRLLHNLASTLELFSAWSVYLLAHGVTAASGAGFRRVLLALGVPLILLAWLLVGLAAVL